MELTKFTVCQAADKIRKKEISVPELTNAYLDRINELNKKIGAYITVCRQEAEKQADRVQKKIDNYEELPIIAGIPAGVNDNICTSGVLTSCGSRMLSNFIPPYDATVIKKFSQNDAVLLGKLNMDDLLWEVQTKLPGMGRLKIHGILSVSLADQAGALQPRLRRIWHVMRSVPTQAALPGRHRRFAALLV